MTQTSRYNLVAAISIFSRVSPPSTPSVLVIFAGPLPRICSSFQRFVPSPSVILRSHSWLSRVLLYGA